MPVLLELTDLRVRSLDLDIQEISWSVENTSEDVLDYTFQVLRSESPAGPFSASCAPFEDRYLFIDNAVPVGDRWRTQYYLVRLTHKASGQSKDFGPVSKEPEADLVAAEIRRHMQLLFREFAGRRCWVLPVRTFGQRCTCWNPTLSQRKRSGCRLCYDTGFIRGYLAPIESWIQFDPSPKTEQTTNVAAQQQSNTTARLAYYPPLKPRDVIIEGENRRWRVVQVNQTEQLRAALHQEIQLHEIPPKDIEYSLPLDLGAALRDLWLAPSRNFTNPQNLDSAESGDTDPLSLYTAANKRK